MKNGSKLALQYDLSITIRYMTKLIMQFLRLNETCRMICYSIISSNVNLVEIGFEWL